MVECLYDMQVTWVRFPPRTVNVVMPIGQAPVLHAGRSGFDSHSDEFGAVAQLGDIQA